VADKKVKRSWGKNQKGWAIGWRNWKKPLEDIILRYIRRGTKTEGDGGVGGKFRKGGKVKAHVVSKKRDEGKKPGGEIERNQSE